MPSVVVLNYGWVYELEENRPLPLATEGDLARVYEGIPFSTAEVPCLFTVSGHVIDSVTLEPLYGTGQNAVTVTGTVDGKAPGVANTDSTGYYELALSGTMKAGEQITLNVSKNGYGPQSETFAHLCDDRVKNFELVNDCTTVTITGTVEDKETGLPIAGATVRATVYGKDPVTTTTVARGAYTLTNSVPFDPDHPIIVDVQATGYNPAVDTVYIPECAGSAQIGFQLHQTPMSRILLYYGNGGNRPTDTEVLTGTHQYYNAEAVFKYFGYHVDYTDSWPPDPDLEEYKVIFLLGPGNWDGDPASDLFTPGQVAQLDLFLRNGGRLVVMSDISATSGTAPITVENTLVNQLNDLDVEFTDANGDGLADGDVQGALADDLRVAAEQLLGLAPRDVNTLNFNTAISITVSGTAAPGWIARMGDWHPDDDAVICAADTPAGINRGGPAGFENGFAGDVVLIGDKDWMDDASFMGTIQDVNGDGTPDYVWPNWPADNENLLLHIFTF
jgi:hypothetical protein